MKKLVILLLTLVLAAGCAFTVYSLAKSGGNGSGSGATIDRPDKSDENNDNTDGSGETPDDTQREESPAEDPTEERTYTVVDLTDRGNVYCFDQSLSFERIQQTDIAPELTSEIKFMGLSDESVKFPASDGKGTYFLSKNGVLQVYRSALFKLLKKSVQTPSVYGENLRIRLYTAEGKAYDIKVDIATKVIYDAEQLASTCVVNKKTLDGYYVLGDDIYCAELSAPIMLVRYDSYVPGVDITAEEVDKCGFKGIFDGRGHVIYDALTDCPYNRLGGFFGNVVEGGLVRDVAFVRLGTTNDLPRTGETARLNCVNLLTGESRIVGGSFENVVVTASENAAGTKLFSRLYSETATIKNLVAIGVHQINFDEEWTSASKDQNKAKIENVISVTGNALYHSYGGFGKSDDNAMLVCPNYKTVNAMIDALSDRNTIAEWDSEYIAFDGTKKELTFNGKTFATKN